MCGNYELGVLVIDACGYSSVIRVLTIGACEIFTIDFIK